MRPVLCFRYLMVRFIFCIMGLRVGYWCKVVERAWSVEARDEYLESLLRSVAPKNAYGNSVTTLREVRESPILTKKAFRKSAAKPNRKAKYHRHTAGSSGNPTDVWLDREELGRMLGVRDYCYRHCGIRVGDREGRLWGRQENGIKSRLKNFLLNRQVFHTAGPSLQKEVQRLISWRPDYLYGYASLLIECAQEIERTEHPIPRMKCVIVTAETILASQKEYLARVFGCSVHEEYGASEFDIIAFECRSGHRHLVNPWLILESGPDFQVLVTDVGRRSQDLVRYELGDVLRFRSTDCSEFGSSNVISTLEGRTANQFALTANNERFHAVEFGYAMDEFQRTYHELFRFTVIQIKPGSFIVQCTPIPMAGGHLLSEHLKSRIKARLGYSLQIETRESGDPDLRKREYFVSGL